MTTPELKQLVADIEASITDPELKLIATTLATQVVRVAAIAATDPQTAEREMAHVKSATTNLTAASLATVEAKILDYFGAVVRSALGLA